MRGITKSAEPVRLAGRSAERDAPRLLATCATAAAGRRSSKCPAISGTRKCRAPLDYTPVAATRYAPEPAAVREAAQVLAKAERPVIYAGQGVHWARAWTQLRQLAELLGGAGLTSLEGKSAFPEDHRLALGSGGVAVPKTGAPFPRPRRRDLRHRLQLHRDRRSASPMPKGKTMIHATLDPDHLNKDIARRDRPHRRCRA